MYAIPLIECTHTSQREFALQRYNIFLECAKKNGYFYFIWRKNIPKFAYV